MGNIGRVRVFAMGKEITDPKEGGRYLAELLGQSQIFLDQMSALVMALDQKKEKIRPEGREKNARENHDHPET